MRTRISRLARRTAAPLALALAAAAGWGAWLGLSKTGSWDPAAFLADVLAALP